MWEGLLWEVLKWTRCILCIVKNSYRAAPPTVPRSSAPPPPPPPPPPTPPPPPPRIIALSISPASISTFPKSFIFIVRLFCLRIRLHLTMEALLPTTLISIAKMELFLTFSWMMMMDSPLYLLPFPWTR